MTLLSNIVSESRPWHPLLLVQSSAAQSGLPILRKIVESSEHTTLLFCLLYLPSNFVEKTASQGGKTEVFNYLGNVPGYNNSYSDLREDISTAVRSAPSEPLNVVIDSLNILASDLGSPSQTYQFLRELFSLICSRQDGSRLLLHATAPSPLIPLLINPSLSPSLVHLICHPPALLIHLATSYLTPPPPLTPLAKFWGLFIPISERGHESDRLVFGTSGEGTGDREIVVEVLVRGGTERTVKRKGVERTLEGWSDAQGGPCELSHLQSLNAVWSRKISGGMVGESTPDPTQNVSFNLNLTPSQQHSRAQVPLPYVHEGNPSERQKETSTSTPAAILYDPDSADDIDDDDPDEDLDI